MSFIKSELANGIQIVCLKVIYTSIIFKKKDCMIKHEIYLLYSNSITGNVGERTRSRRNFEIFSPFTTIKPSGPIIQLWKKARKLILSKVC